MDPGRRSCKNADQSCKFTYLLDNPRARWVKLDFGESTDGIGSRVGGRFGIYKRFVLPETDVLMKAFYPKFRRDCPGLEEFWKKIDAQDWAGATSALRTYEEKRYQKSTGMPAERWEIAKLGLEDKIDLGNGNILHFRKGVDWQIHPDNALNDCGRGWAHMHVAKAWSQTQEQRYADKFIEFTTTWLEQLPRPPDTNRRRTISGRRLRSRREPATGP